MKLCLYDYGPCADPNCEDDLACNLPVDEGKNYCPEHDFMEEA